MLTFVLGVVVGCALLPFLRALAGAIALATEDRLPWDSTERRQMMIAHERRARHSR